MATCNNCSKEIATKGADKFCSYQCHREWRIKQIPDWADQAVNLYTLEKLGCKRIAKQVGSTDGIARAVLIKKGVYEYGSFHNGGERARLLLESRKQAAEVKRLERERIRASLPPKPKPLTREEKNAKALAYYYANHEKYKTLSRARALATYYANKDNPEWIKTHKQKCRDWQRKNKDRKREYELAWRKKNPDKWRNCQRRARNKPKTKIAHNLRRRVRQCIGKGLHIPSTQKLVGCSREFLVKWIESKFTKGMSWDNYGEWHIDHIIPCASFNLLEPEHQRQCFHYSNLQPLWAADNISKSDTMPTAQPELAIAI